MKTLDSVVSWFTAPRTPSIPKDEAVTLLHTMHPRTIFLKTLPRYSSVLDLGAGDGSVSVFRNWLRPKRTDLKLYAYGLRKGRQFDQYDGYELGKWPSTPPKFPGVQFNAVFCSHFIEHIEDPIPVLQWVSNALPTEGRFYLEWPSPQSKELPSKSELAHRGVDIIISNFSDDATHIAVHDRGMLSAALCDMGFLIQGTGYISLPFLEEELLASKLDNYAKQAAYWSNTLWAQYVVAVKQ